MPIASILFNIARICKSQFKGNYLTNEKLFLNFLFHFWNLHQILNILKKEMIVIANVFPKLQTVKNLFRPLCKKLFFGTRLDSRRLKVSRILAKECFYDLFSSIWGKSIWKISPIVLGETQKVFVNRLTADGKYRGHYCVNLQLPIQGQLLFLNFLFQFWNLHQILNILKKNMIVIGNMFPNL